VKELSEKYQHNGKDSSKKNQYSDHETFEAHPDVPSWCPTISMVVETAGPLFTASTSLCWRVVVGRVEETAKEGKEGRILKEGC